jgi:hypothetical protein
MACRKSYYGPRGGFGIWGSISLPASIIVQKKEQKKWARLLPITQQESRQLRFPIGHPREQILYVGHPIDAKTYIPLFDFHRFLFEHKTAEGLRLVRELGANNIWIEHVQGWDERFGIELSTALPVGVQVELGASHEKLRSRGSYTMSEMTLHPTGPPRVPSDLVWLARAAVAANCSSEAKVRAHTFLAHSRVYR